MSEATYRQMTFTPRELAEARDQSDGFAGFWAQADIIADNLGLDLAQLEGSVLNVGAGVGMSLEHAISQVAKSAKVISYDLSYRTDLDDYESFGQLLKESLSERAEENGSESVVGSVAVAGYAEVLPFRNEAFNLTIAHASVPTHSRNYGSPSTTRQLISALAEMVRVTAPVGQVITSPISHDRVDEINQFMNCQALSPEVKDWTLEEFSPRVNKTGVQAYRLTIQK